MSRFSGVIIIIIIIIIIRVLLTSVKVTASLLKSQGHVSIQVSHNNAIVLKIYGPFSHLVPVV